MHTFEAMLKNCPVCGKRISDTASYCPACGAALPKDSGNASSHTAAGSNTGSSRTRGGAARSGRARSALHPLFLVTLGLVVLVVLLFMINIAIRLPGISARQSALSRATERLEQGLGAEGLSEQVLTAVCGSYQGRDRSGFTFYPDGTAAYYSESTQFCEPACSWTCLNDRIYVKLEKLHCVVEAPVPSGDDIFLRFTSSSPNWQDEDFRKLTETTSFYREEGMKNSAVALITEPDGSMHASFGGLTFAFPKHYANYPQSESIDSDPDKLILVSVDGAATSVSGIIFDYREYTQFDSLKNNLEGEAKYFVAGFVEDYTVSTLQEDTVGGLPALKSSFTGKLLPSFASLEGYSVKGTLTFVCDQANNRVLNIMMLQTVSGPDLSKEFDQILHSPDAG